MNNTLWIVLVVVAALGAPVGYVFYEAQLSSDNWIYQGGSFSNWTDGGLHGVPGPIVGAGLPIILAVGYGAYRLGKRRRKAS